MESFILKSVALMDEEKGEKLKKFSMTEHVIVCHILYLEAQF